MKTHIQPGHSITVTARTGGVLSGHGVLLGTLFGIAQFDAVEGAQVEILTGRCRRPAHLGRHHQEGHDLF